MICFWSLAFFYAWAGMHHLIGGPFPAWLISASVVASVMMFVPVIAVAINQHLTMAGHFSAWKWSLTWGGWFQGIMLNRETTPILEIEEYMLP